MGGQPEPEVGPAEVEPAEMGPAEPVGPVAEFVAALRHAEATLAGVRARLAGTSLPDAAFGKLFEAREVRDVYHSRLPVIDLDLAEAGTVLGHFVAGLSGGHRIVDTP